MLPSSNKLQVYLLGTFHLEFKAQSIHLPTRKVESLLAYLILYPAVHTREKLAALFWGDSPEAAARGSLRKALTLLRKHIDPEIVFADRETIQLNSSFPVWVDVIEFQRQAHEFLNDPSSHTDSTDFYQGDLLCDFYDDWVLPLRKNYSSLYSDVLLRSVEESRAQSEYNLAIGYAQKILDIDPTNEHAHQHLMFCYITLGDRNKALQQFEACQQVLQNELAVEPTRETQALYHWIRQSIPGIPSLAARVTNLPIPISSFVGRNKELKKVKRLLRSARLVTLTGAGGSGKTRLAIHAATDLIDTFKDGVWWVELAPLTDPLLVSSAVAKALGIDGRSDQPMTESLKKFLHTKNALLVLDNCEHLIDACARLIEILLTSCAGIKILATSRETLSLTGEHVWPVPALSLPNVQNITLINLLMQYEGIRLFAERAVAINPDFTPNDENAVSIAQVCKRLDGIPLAIELAAARIKTMSVGEISDGLDDRFQLLTAQNRTAQTRHQTLRAAVDWSYELLTVNEKKLFCRLSVFSGGWELDAAETVCSGDGIEKEDVPDLLAHLVEKSLVKVNADGQRFGMLETMRQYGKEKLSQLGRRDRIIQHHLDYYLKMAIIGDEKIRGSEQFTWFKWFDAEQENLAGAMERSLASPDAIEQGCELVCSMCWYWKTLGEYNLMEYWLRQAYSRSDDLEKMSAKAKLLFNVGFYSIAGLYWLKPPDAYSIIEESLAIWQKLGVDFTCHGGQCLLILGFIQKGIFDDDNGYDHMNQAVAIFTEIGNVWWHAFALNLIGAELVDDLKDKQLALQVLEEETVLWKKTGDQCASAVVLWDLGTLAYERGDIVEAKGFFQEALQRYLKFGAKSYILQTLINLGDISRSLKQYDQAESYYHDSIPLIQDTMWNSWLSRACQGLGYVALADRDFHQADEYFHQALKISKELDLKFLQILCLAGYASLAVVRGELHSAVRLFGTYFTQWDCLKSDLKTSQKIAFRVDQMEIEGYLDLCKAEFSKTIFTQVWDEGRSLSISDVINRIMQEGA